MSFRTLFSVMLIGGVVCATVSAAPIFGSFTMSGVVTVTANTITWQSDAAGNAANRFTLNNGTGSFSVIPNGSQEGIANLANPPQVVGSPFPATPFITFLTNPSFPTLDINFIFAGIYGSSQCFAIPAVGQQCTLPGSPFNFVNNPGAGPAPIQATATWVFSGVSSDNQSAWVANMTSQFNVPFQTVLAGFAPGQAGGSQTNTYSAIATVSLVPEPATILIVGGALFLLADVARRRRRLN